MKRGEFIRLSGLALLGLAVAPALKTVEVLKPLPQKKVITLKVSTEMLSDPDAFELALKSYIPKDGNVKNIRMGYIDDDFIRNMQTLVIELS